MSDQSLLDQWVAAKRQLDYWKAEEQRLRIEVAHREDDFKGMISVAVPTNYTVDQDCIRHAWDELTDEEKECIRWRASVAEPQFRKLDVNVEYEIFNCVTAKPGLVQVKLKV